MFCLSNGCYIEFDPLLKRTANARAWHADNRSSPPFDDYGSKDNLEDHRVIGQHLALCTIEFDKDVLGQHSRPIHSHSSSSLTHAPPRVIALMLDTECIQRQRDSTQDLVAIIETEKCSTVWFRY